jgi:hypothetical protein
MVTFYRCVVYLFLLLDFLECHIICFMVSELLLLPSMVAILLIGLPRTLTTEINRQHIYRKQPSHKEKTFIIVSPSYNFNILYLILF